jgi:prepilin-type N-terminal cleavage/methylation domain-containing protein
MNKFIKQAFTLIELLVVIAIIGILSGLIVISMGGVTQKANIAKSQVFSNSFKNSLLLNLVSEWKFDGSTTDGLVATVSDVLDTWGGLNNGTLSAVPPTVKTGSNCVIGSCLQFNGSNNYVEFGTDSSLSMGAGDASFSFWVKFDNALAPQYETLIAGGGTVAPIEGFWIRRENGNSRLFGRLYHNATNIDGYLSATNSLVDNIWYNIVVMFDRDNVTQTYINGAKTTYSFNLSTLAGDVQNTGTVRIGAWTSSSYRFTGKMDEVRLYNAITSISQIKQNYYIGLNSLLSSNQIDSKEYLERINSIANNE